MPVSIAAFCSVRCGCWSPTQMSTRLSLTITVALPGSMRPRRTYGTEYVASMIRARAAHRDIDVPLIDDDLARRLQLGRVLGEDRRGRRGAAGPPVPLDRHRLERLVRMPPGVGDDCDAAAVEAVLRRAAKDLLGLAALVERQPDNGVDAWHAPHGVEVEAPDVTAPRGTALGRRVQHARHADIDRVLRRACDLDGHVAVRLLGAHQRPLVRRFHPDLRWIRQLDLRGLPGNRTVVDRAFRLGVGNDAVLGDQLRDRHLPLGGRRQQQPLPRFGSRQLQVEAAFAHVAARADAHPAVDAGVRLRPADLVRLAAARRDRARCRRPAPESSRPALSP